MTDILAKFEKCSSKELKISISHLFENLFSSADGSICGNTFPISMCKKIKSHLLYHQISFG